MTDSTVPGERWGENPAVLVVDVSRRAADPELQTSVPEVVEAADNIETLLETARETDVPVLFSRGGLSYYTSGGADLTDAERGGWTKQNPIRDESREEAEHAITIAPRLGPRDDETVVTKTAPSAFFGSMLTTYLSSMGVDTLVVTGIMTSCCVRATVTDAFSHDYWIALPDECIGDHRPDAHDLHMAEMDSKFADATSMDVAADYLRDVGK